MVRPIREATRGFLIRAKLVYLYALTVQDIARKGFSIFPLRGFVREGVFDFRNNPYIRKKTAMEKQTEQEIHDLSFECFRELESLENTPTYEHNAKSISPMDKLRKLRAICCLYAAKCDELELKIIEEDGTDK